MWSLYTPTPTPTPTPALQPQSITNRLNKLLRSIFSCAGTAALASPLGLQCAIPHFLSFPVPPKKPRLEVHALRNSYAVTQRDRLASWGPGAGGRSPSAVARLQPDHAMLSRVRLTTRESARFPLLRSVTQCTRVAFPRVNNRERSPGRLRPKPKQTKAPHLRKSPSSLCERLFSAPLREKRAPKVRAISRPELFFLPLEERGRGGGGTASAPATWPRASRKGKRSLDSLAPRVPQTNQPLQTREARQEGLTPLRRNRAMDRTAEAV